MIRDMSTIREIIQERLSALEAEIAECKRALAAVETPARELARKIGIKDKEIIHISSDGDVTTKRNATLADIITEILKQQGPASRNDIVTEVQLVRSSTNAQTVSGTLNGMSKAGVVKLRNKKWSLMK